MQKKTAHVTFLNVLHFWKEWWACGLPLANKRIENNEQFYEIYIRCFSTNGFVWTWGKISIDQPKLIIFLCNFLNLSTSFPMNYTEVIEQNSFLSVTAEEAIHDLKWCYTWPSEGRSVGRWFGQGIRRLSKEVTEFECTKLTALSAFWMKIALLINFNSKAKSAYI